MYTGIFLFYPLPNRNFCGTMAQTFKEGVCFMAKKKIFSKLHDLCCFHLFNICCCICMYINKPAVGFDNLSYNFCIR